MGWQRQSYTQQSYKQSQHARLLVRRDIVRDWKRAGATEFIEQQCNSGRPVSHRIGRGLIASNSGWPPAAGYTQYHLAQHHLWMALLVASALLVSAHAA